MKRIIAFGLLIFAITSLNLPAYARSVDPGQTLHTNGVIEPVPSGEDGSYGYGWYMFLSWLWYR